MLHFAGAWDRNSNQAERICWDAPLRDGTMVQQCGYAGGCCCRFFCCLPDGSQKNAGTMFQRDGFFNGGGLDSSACCTIDGVEMDEEAFQAALALGADSLGSGAEGLRLSRRARPGRRRARMDFRRETACLLLENPV